MAIQSGCLTRLEDLNFKLTLLTNPGWFKKTIQCRCISYHCASINQTIRICTCTNETQFHLIFQVIALPYLEWPNRKKNNRLETAQHGESGVQSLIAASTSSCLAATRFWGFTIHALLTFTTYYRRWPVRVCVIEVFRKMKYSSFCLC